MNLIQHTTKQLRLRLSKHKYFPKNFRFITEFSQWLNKERKVHVPKKPFWVGFLLSLAVILIGLLSYMLSVLSVQWFALQHQRAQLTAQLQLWEEIVQKYPTYRDAYFEAARIAYRLNDREKSWKLVQKVLAIDPNFAAGKELELRLEKGN